MTTRFRGIVTLGVAVALLGACAGPETSPPVAPAVPAPSLGQALASRGIPSGLTDSHKSPCVHASGWSFKGPCIRFLLPHRGKTVTLAPYHRLSVRVHFTESSSDGRAMVVGMGTSDADIPGTLYGTIFPEYGTSDGCIGANLQTVTCRGKGFLYVLTLVPSSNVAGTGLPVTPAFKVSTTGSFPGAKCQVSLLAQANNPTVGWAWQELSTAKPLNGTLALKSYPQPITFEPGEFEAFAFHCW